MKNRHELGMVLAYALYDLQGGARDVAVMSSLMQNVGSVFEAYALSAVQGTRDVRTAPVNLGRLNLNSSNRVVYSTAVPTTADLGIMALLRMKAIYYVDSASNPPTIKKIDIKSPVPTLSNATVVNLDSADKNDQLRPALEDVNGTNAPWFTVQKAQAAQLARAWLAYPRAVNGAIPAQSFSGASVQSAQALAQANPQAPGQFQPAFQVTLPTAGAMVGQTYRDLLFVSLTRVLAAATWQGAGQPYMAAGIRDVVGFSGGKNIAAVLVNAQNQIIGWGLNTNDEHPTQHAETNAILAFQGNPGTALPGGTLIYSTLEPCFMCAGLFVQAGGGRCFFEQEDPNMVGNTALAGNEEQYRDPWPNSQDPQGPQTSIGQELTRMQGQSGQRAPDFLATAPASDIFRRAVERFVVVGMRAQAPAEKELWQQALAFLKQGPLGPIMNQPDLLPVD